jgi:hypothetical protein
VEAAAGQTAKLECERRAVVESSVCGLRLHGPRNAAGPISAVTDRRPYSPQRDVSTFSCENNLGIETGYHEDVSKTRDYRTVYRALKTERNRSCEIVLVFYNRLVITMDVVPMLTATARLPP